MMGDNASIPDPAMERPNASELSNSSPPVWAMHTLTDTQRNGSITGIGIVLGFSLTFCGQWSLGSETWHYWSVLPLGFALPGILLQLRALFRVLSLPMITLDDHKSMGKLFLWGVMLVLSGYIIGVVVDLGIDKGWLPCW